MFSSPSPQCVLGYPRLKKHNLVLNWQLKRVDQWSEFCLNNCLISAVPLLVVKESSPEEISHEKVPQEYNNLLAVFTKSKALSLPPHRPYDCAIELLPGAPLPSSHLYNLSAPERESMKNYIEESLVSGIIRPSTSPVGAEFFFVEKNDKIYIPALIIVG